MAFSPRRQQQDDHAAVHLLGERQAESAAFSPLGLHHQERFGRERLDVAVNKKGDLVSFNLYPKR